MAKDTIIRLQPSDIISESMNKINYNFDLLTSQSEVDEYKYTALFKQLNDRIDELRRNSDSRDADLANGITTLNDKVDGLSSSTLDIQDAINSAVAAANQSLRDFIVSTVGQQVERAIGDYATTSSISMDDVNAAIAAALAGLPDPSTGDFDPNSIDWDSIDWDSMDLGYVRSAAFEEFKADSKKRHAEASTIVANSTFVSSSDGYLIYDQSRERSPYKNTWGGFRGFYESNEVTDAQRTEINPENKPWEEAIFDSNFINGLIALMELKFLTVATEMSVIRQKVDEGEASTEIITTVKKALGIDDEDMTTNDAEDITAAIFLKATQMGSEIALYADQIRLAAEHKLIMETDTFEIHSNNFDVTSNGDVTANNAIFTNGTFSGDVTVRTLNAAGGKTTIDINGNLTARNAKISGEITADQFSASEDVEIENEDDYSGTITKNTIINGSTFNISATGTLTNIAGNTRNVTGNQLYIKILDKLENNGQNTEINDAVMYGVPALCMQYIDSNGDPHEYVLNPNTWKDLSVAAADTSNMRWLSPYGGNSRVLKYSTNTYSLDSTSSWKHYKGTVNSSSTFNGSVYIFSPEIRNQMIPSNTAEDEIYRFYVYSLGSSQNESTNLGYLKRDGLIKNATSVTKSNMNDYAAYALKSKIDSKGGSSYCGPSESQTRIDSNLSQTFGGYLQDSISCGLKLRINQEYDKLVTSFGIQNLYDFIVYAAGGVGQQYSSSEPVNNIWDLESSITGLTSVSSRVKGDEGFINNLPFATGGYYTSGNNHINEQYIDISIDVYPMIDITDSGKTVASNTKTIYGNCSITVIGGQYVYGNASYQGTPPIKILWEKLDTSSTPHQTRTYDAEFIPNSIQLKLDFDFVFALSGNGIEFDPLNAKKRGVSDNGEDNIMNRVYTFLKTFDFVSNIKSNKTYNTIYYRHAQFDAICEGTAKQTKNGSTTVSSATLRKTTIL